MSYPEWFAFFKSEFDKWIGELHLYPYDLDWEQESGDVMIGRFYNGWHQELNHKDLELTVTRDDRGNFLFSYTWSNPSEDSSGEGEASDPSMVAFAVHYSSL